MQYRQLGDSGLRVSAISLGTMTFGATTGDAGVARIVNAARDAGVNFIDTAEAYAGGASERATGRAIRRDRDAWVLATKVGQTDGPPARKMGLSRKWMMTAIDRSLARLGTDYVDIYYMHHVDWTTPLAESVAAMGDIVAAGKARYWGFSNHRGWQIGELVRLADAVGAPRPVIAQPLYNLVMRMAETDILPACEHYGIGVAPYSPLARGVLTGKYDPAAKPPANTRAGRGDNSILNRDFRPASFAAVERIKAHAAGRGMSAIDFALLWVLNCATVTSVIAGPRTLGQWRAYLGALRHEFTAEDEAFAAALVPAGHASSPHYVDRMYPPQGRRARAGEVPPASRPAGPPHNL